MNVQNPHKIQSNHKKNLLLQLSNERTLYFLIILIVALYLRIQAIHFDLPYGLNPDESNYLSKILYLSKHFLNPNTVCVPSFFLYLNALVVCITQGGLDIGAMLSSLRFFSVLSGVGSIVVVYFIGGFFNSLVGVLASGFLAVSFLHLKFSQMFLPFSAMTFFSLLSVFFALSYFVNKNSKALVTSTVFALLSTSMNYLGVISLLSVLMVLVLNKELNKFKSLIILFLISFLLLNPYFLFLIFKLLSFLITSYIKNYYFNHSSSYFLYLFDFLLEGVGPVVWVSALGLLKYKEEYDLNYLKILFLLPFLYLGFLGLFHLTSQGYAVLLVPYVCLASALAFNSLWETAQQHDNTSAQRFILIVLLLFAFYVPFKYSLKYNKLMSLSDTRMLATEWIRKNTSSGYKIAWDKNSIQLNRQRFQISQKLLKRKDWLKTLKKKVDYVVINSLDFESALRQGRGNLMKKYYSTILKLKPEITFNPYLLEREKEIRKSQIEDLYSPFESLWQRERAGPLIKIYKL